MALERIEPSAQKPPRGGRRVLFLYRAGDAAAGSVAVDRYRRRVALLKRLLPAVGVALLLLVAAWPRVLALLRSGPLALPAIDLRQARELTMVDARYAGVDRQNRPYVVTAAIARQLPKQKDLLALEKPRAELTVRSGSWIVMTGRSGVYQSAVGLLDLFGRVDLRRQDGTRFETRRAHLNLSADTARGEDPVEGQGPMGKISAEGFRVLDKGNTILFTGKARALLYAGKASALAAPPSLPPAIARKAALLETAALALLRPKRAAKPGRSAARSAHGRHLPTAQPLARGHPPRARPRLLKAPGDGG